MICQPNFPEAYNLLHDGASALTDVTNTGICIDIPYLHEKREELTIKLKNTSDRIYATPEGKIWMNQYHRSVKFNSLDQLNDIFFNKCGHARPIFEEDYDPADEEDDSADKKVLKELSIRGIECASLLLNYRKYSTVLNRYIHNLLVETIDGIVHPNFPLNKARTYRGASNDPNFQNMPIRDEEMGRLIREAILPRPGHRLMEADYKALEVRIQACYHKDPRMIDEVTNPERDMHRDESINLFKLHKFNWKDVKDGKKIRTAEKNLFVFATTYGSYYKNTAPAIWRDLINNNYRITDNLSVLDHLKMCGIYTDEQFKEHVRKVEYDFWNKKFPIYKKWREDWYSDYLKKGYFYTYTGFKCSGVMKRTDVINYPVQGPAFHCLLKALIIMNEWLKSRGLKSRIIAQIHDSIILDVVDEEVDIVARKLQRVMTELIPQLWPWITVPLAVEIDLTPIDGSWFSKERFKI